MTDFARYLNIRSAISPVLSPDGSRVAFLSDISGNLQVWSVATGRDVCEWPRQLTFFADKVWEVHGTSAASHLIAVSDVGGNERQQFYLISGYGGPQTTHDVRRLTTNDQAIHRFGAFSSDGQRILYTCNDRNGTDFDLYVLDIASGDVSKICEMSGNRGAMAWSPDDRYALVAEAVGPLQVELYLVDLADGDVRRLTPEDEPARYSAAHWTDTGVYLLSDRLHDRGGLCRLDVETGDVTAIVSADAHAANGEFELLSVSGDGVQAAYTYNHEGFSELWQVNLASGQRHLVDGLPPGMVSKISVQASGDLILDLQTPDRNPNIWLVRAEEKPRSLTQSDQAGLDPASFVAPQLIHYSTFDGRSIPAFYYVPRTAQPEGGYPCILYVHGGPTSQLRPDFDVRFQYFLSQGYAILGPNVRGSSGYGRTYAALDDVEKRMDSVADLKHAVLWLQQRPEINPERIAIYGRSYGGFMVLAALTEYPELFAAGIDVVGIANWVTFMERTSSWRRAHREKEYGSLAHHRDVLERISPIHKADRITMPLMVIAGDNDPRVPLFESEQIVEKVRANGGTVEFLHYADEGHKISKLQNRIDSFGKMAEFLHKFV
jgi:dipeptidyl aminopeptidase/acylaminoacyl peptidase